MKHSGDPGVCAAGRGGGCSTLCSNRSVSIRGRQRQQTEETSLASLMPSVASLSGALGLGLACLGFGSLGEVMSSSGTESRAWDDWKEKLAESGV